MMFMFIVPAIYLVAPLLSVVAIVSLGCSFVMLNSFLPLMAANHPLVRSQNKLLSDEVTASQSSPALNFSNVVSAKGVGLGYAAAVLVQLLCIATLLLAAKFTQSRTIPLRLAIFLAAIWWFAFTFPTYVWLRNRPGPPLPAALSQSHSTLEKPPSRLKTAFVYTAFAWRSTFRTLRQALRLSQARLFLLAWFLMSDAVATVSSTAIMFARTELSLSPTSIALLSITATSSGIVGSLLWPRISAHYSLSTSRTIVLCLSVMEFVPLYGLLGYLPPVQALGWLGLQQAWEIFPLAVVHGVAMGGLSSYCRSFFGQLIPPGREAAFYALFAITDKGSSAIGPAVVGRIVDATGTIRPAFWFLAVLIGLPILLVWFVDGAKGRVEALEEAGRIDGEEQYEMVHTSEIEEEGLMSDQGRHAR
jgi:MFS transporter, UMF1 family